METMKSKLDLYNKMGMYCTTKMDDNEVRIAIDNFYYLRFYLDDAIRDLKCILSVEFFQKDLYGNDEKTKKIHYYHHHINSLFCNIALINDYVKEINSRDFSKGIIGIQLDEMPRHKIQHFLQDSKKFRNQGHLIHGLNVIISEEDIHLREVKDINRLLDLLENKYYYLRNIGEMKQIDIIELNEKLINFKITVDNIWSFIEKNWLTWH